ncbi:hypothetical protein LIS54_000775 [Escherichia coli]|nr:hypothetical protein [Escherichia coli]EJF1647873.1 hypothetical protein [Escherichia coli]MCZ5371528.1 hypothetical protein [Escherichia coli]
MFDAALLNLPWETLVTLTCGYIGYFVANVGINDGHKATEITFSTLIFGMFSAMVYRAFVWAGVDTWTATFPAVAYAFASGAYWRKYARKWMYAFLRKHDISWSDSTPSAWQGMFGHTDHSVTEVLVHLKDGSVLLSHLPGDFEDWPGGPFTLGNCGDITLYVTHRKKKGGNEWVKCKNTTDDRWGVLATWIPQDQIARVDIRRIKAVGR